MTLHNVPPPAPDPSQEVLLVEDNDSIANALAHLLDRAGYRAKVFSRGGEALAYTADHRPAAAVVDIHLPDISGLILSQLLRQRFGPGWPIIVCSGDSSMENLNALPHVGATYFIGKPVNTDHLLERLRELVA